MEGSNTSSPFCLQVKSCHLKLVAALILAFGVTACSTTHHDDSFYAGAAEKQNETGVSDALLEDMPQEWNDSYAANPEVQAFIHHMVQDYSYDKASLELAFSRIKAREAVIEKSDNQPEVLVPYWQYKKRFLSENRISEGKAFAKRNWKWLQKAQSEFGVDWRVIVALIGVETHYGRIIGSRDVFTSLTTLTFDYPRRKAYFQGELEAYLLLARKQGWNIGATKGSYSGAMGMVQFMPSNYEKLAIDYDGDGRIDLWGSEADAIGSVANYMKHHGWQAGKPWFVVAQVNRPDVVSDWVNKGHSPTKEMSEWSSLGVLPVQAFIPGKTGLIALKTEEEKESFWLAYENFFTVMDYNPSRRYAMSVLELAQSIGNDETP